MRGPKYVVTKGKTPVLAADEARARQHRQTGARPQRGDNPHFEAHCRDDRHALVVDFRPLKKQ